MLCHRGIPTVPLPVCGGQRALLTLIKTGNRMRTNHVAPIANPLQLLIVYRRGELVALIPYCNRDSDNDGWPGCRLGEVGED